MRTSAFDKKLLYFPLILTIPISLYLSVHKPAQISEQTTSGDRKEEANASLYAQYLFDVRKNFLTQSLDYTSMINAFSEVNTKRFANKKDAIGLNWTELGPDNIGGRTRAFLIDKNNTNRFYSGGVGGGLWISNDAGLTWTKWSGSDQLEALSISCITQSADGTIYFGTGEGFTSNPGNSGSTPGFIGGGIWKSTDNTGNNFSLLTATKPTANSSSTSWAIVYNMAAHPTDPNIIYAGTNAGLRKTENAGSSWVSLRSGDCYDVEVGSDGSVVASVANVCWVSPDGSAGSFVNKSGASTGLLTSTASRLELAIAPQDPNYIYAAIAAGNSIPQNRLLAVYRTTDKGNSWTNLGSGSGSFDPFSIFGNGAVVSAQGFYDNTIEVFPNDKNHVLIGGIDLWEGIVNESNSATSWTQISLYRSEETSPLYSLYMHPDKHNIKFDPNNPNIFYCTNDGGVYKGVYSATPSPITGSRYAYTALNKGYNVTQFYSVCFESYDDEGNGGAMGGTQDNGTLYIKGNAGFTMAGTQFTGGDGGDCEISAINPKVFISSVPRLDEEFLFRSAEKDDGNAQDLKAPNLPSSVSAPFVSCMSLYENTNASNSPDSVNFIAEDFIQTITKQNNSQQTFSGTFDFSAQPNAILVPGSIRITSGNQVITDDGSGNLTGSVTGSSNTINYQAKQYNFTFSSTPPASANIIATFRVEYAGGSTIYVKSKVNSTPFPYEISVSLGSRDTIRVKDIIQSKLALGLGGSAGVWITKEILDFSKNPTWIKVINTLGSDVAQSMAWSPDGDVLYVGTSLGALYRVTNIAAVKDSLTGDERSSSNVTSGKVQIGQFNGFITSISVDPNNGNRVLVTLGGYSNIDHVYLCEDATNVPAATNTSNFIAKQGSGSSRLPFMPVYSSLFVKSDPNTVLVGTEYGVYSTTDITATSPSWSDENTSMARVPVFAMRQQTLPPWNCNNSGNIYIGTHGRGIWKCTSYFSPNTGIASKDPIKSSKQNLVVFPNPANASVDNVTIKYTFTKNEKVTLKMYDLQGKVVALENYSVSAGEQKLVLKTANLLPANYIISLTNNKDIKQSGRLVITP